ncbi:MAG: S41 family peptidase [Coriobacteriia bacterium]|nr:S41 family peptidase [Coriobacteriia bacterium]MBN2823642.1 S41 family peptidase [Coriobacteriia bacterium]
MNRLLKWVTVAVVAATLVVASFGGGVVFGRLGVSSSGITGSASLQSAVLEVRDIIEGQAYEPSSDSSITAGAIRGMLDSLDDPYAAYFDEKHFEMLDEQNRGEFYGIGIVVTTKEGIPTVVSVMENTPAQSSGLKADDQILSIDGTQKDEWDLDEVVGLIRGPEGTDVELGIARGEDDLFDITVTRAKIETPNTESEMLDGSIGYVRLYTFNEKSADSLRKAIESLEDDGAEGIVLDLRDNPGGLLSSSVDVVSLFVKDGVVVTVKDRDGGEEVYRATGDVATDLPLTVLINENSASASEIVAGALQDYGRGELVGVKSYGKGSVQQIDTLSFGGGIKLTIARYFTPKDRSIDKVGLEPDVEVEMELADQADKATDVQLEKAADLLRSR